MNLQQTGHTPSSAPDEIDRLLAAHFAVGEELAPSSGFASSVMRELHAQSAAPPPLPFPWRRVVPGMVALVCMLAAFCVFAVRKFAAVTIAPASPATLQALPTLHLNPVEQALCWAAASACLAIAVAAASVRLTGTRKGMRI